MIVGKERFESVKMIDRLDHDHPVGGVFEDMKKKVRHVSDTDGLTVVTCTPPGSAHGCLRKWKDLHAVPHIVRPFPVMRSPRKHGDQHTLLSQLKQSSVSHHKVRCNHRRRAESCSLPR